MKPPKRVLIVGCGGIGSFLARHLYELVRSDEWNQFPNVNFTFADDDTVDFDNLSYQCFELDDVTDDKAEVISEKYGFVAINRRIVDPEELKGYDCIVSAVDGTKFRKMLFEFCDKHPNIYWIDLRSESKSVAMFTKGKKTTLEYMLATIPEQKEGGSCQLEFEKRAGTVQLGNRIVSTYGTQALLNWHRGDKNKTEIVQTF